MKDNLPQALSDSICDNAIDTGADLLDVGIDALLKDDLLRNIPLISTAVGIFKIGHTINELHLLKKLATFVNAINNGIVNETERNKYRLKIISDTKKREKELEYLLILINRYIDTNKTKKLSKFYLAYLDEKITWEELTVFAEITDRFLPRDYELLKSSQKIKAVKTDKESALRLMALGLLVELDKRQPIEVSYETLYVNGNTTNEYRRTALGDKYVLIIENDL